ncbi:hypothetical protein GFC01_08490 [Desulfofundulus thermobenzoicus]|uniref:Uncharacterized protein n=1 Tax=Desulfofundulus thermobenzoicus TaxID=29376 RepID=A0A6N7IS70_9FIRM|nr:hypothetical protein [Desulfofundulus thermobenzoicus]MQL52307.1 hypothetical protein [Desulfofundulus thermobenzoicus]
MMPSLIRLEAVRASFRKVWQERDYQTIVAVARKFMGNVLPDDPKILVWYDQTLSGMGVAC